MINMICKEIDLQKAYLQGDVLETIYIGGGTPSLLSRAELDLIFSTISKHFSFSDLKEITMEANPDDLNSSKIDSYKGGEINRFSVGIQSFYDDELSYLNRAHSSAEASSCIYKLQEAGFENITLDLIFGIPNSNRDKWMKNVEKALKLNVPHLSCYALTIEERTVFGNWFKKGTLKVEDDLVVNEQFTMLMDKMTEKGYEQYEISNYAKPNFRAVHNTNYWSGEKYLGIGPGAHSYNGDSRQYNISNNTKYIDSIRKGKVPFDIEMLTKDNKVNEYIMTSLRTGWGCNTNYISKRFGVILNTEVIRKFIEQDKWVSKDGIITLTRSGKLIADELSSQLFI